jgi:hypothetical protein
MLSKCVECDHLLVGDEVEYLCNDCYRAIKKSEAIQEEKGTFLMETPKVYLLFLVL